MKRFFSFILMTVIVVVLLNAAGQEPNILIVSGVDDALWPDSPAGRCAKAYIKAYRAEGDEAMRRFISEHRSPDYNKAIEEKLTQYQGLRKQIGQLADSALKIHNDYDLEVIARSAAMDLWLSIRFKLEANPPHYLAQMSIMPTADPKTVIPEYSSQDSLSQLLEKARSDAGAPAMAAAVVRGGKIVEVAAAGVRENNKPGKVEINDRFHLGSVTKAMTATMIGKLVEDKILRWDMKVSEVFPGLTIKAVYRDVTLEQLLTHRGGLPPYSSDEEFEDFHLAAENLSATQQRAALVAYVLNREPAAIPGERMLYSNAGYVVAAHMAESITKKSWEELMSTLLFKPLGFRSAGFGWPATADRPHQPRGHFNESPNLRAQVWGDEEPVPLYLAPAGNVHCSVEDLARFAIFHLRGLNGQDGILKAETIRRLHKPPEGRQGDGKIKYAFGWLIDASEEGEAIHWHSGTAGMFYAQVSLFPGRNMAVVVVTNAGLHCGPVVQKVIDALFQRKKP